MNTIIKLGLASMTLFGMAFGSSPTNCGEIIKITDMNFGGAGCSNNQNFPCSTLEGDYYFNGYDSVGNPIYKQQSTGAYFDLLVETIGSETKYSLAYNVEYDDNGVTRNVRFETQYDHHADVDRNEINGCTTDEFKVEYGALTGATNIIYYDYLNDGYTYAPLYIVATLDDCDSVGLDNKDAPTPSPTPKPTLNQCPNYDTTVYANCDDDTHCDNCEPWGCATCESGYYKMGILMRCQSCTANYPGCSSCQDFNGCATCTNSQNALYNGDCNDETCYQLV